MELDKIPVPVILSYTFMQRDHFRWPKSTHSKWVLMLVETGLFECKMQGKTYLVSEGEAFFIPSNVLFERQVIEPLRLHYFEIDWSATFPGTVPLPVGKLQLLSKERVKSTMALLHRLEYLDHEDSQPICQHFVYDLWIYYLIETATNRAHDTRVPQDPIVLNAVRIFREQYGKKVQIQFVAERLNLSPAEFSRRFSKEMGMTPRDYLSFLRLSEAKKLLVETTLPIRQISDHCGYENQFYFCNRFKKQMGISPLQYRKKYFV